MVMKISNTGISRVLLVLIVFFTGTSLGISVRSVNLDELVGLSERVFLGRVAGVKSSFDSRIGINVTSYTFIVTEGLKGVKTGDTIHVRQVGGTAGAPSPVSGLPVYRKGGEILLFLHGDSRLGLTSPVGLLQGVFREVKMPDGSRGYLNGAGNRNLETRAEDTLRSAVPAPGESLFGAGTDPAPITIEMLRGFISSRGARGVELK